MAGSHSAFWDVILCSIRIIWCQTPWPALERFFLRGSLCKWLYLAKGQIVYLSLCLSVSTDTVKERGGQVLTLHQDVRWIVLAFYPSLLFLVLALSLFPSLPLVCAFLHLNRHFGVSIAQYAFERENGTINIQPSDDPTVSNQSLDSYSQ